MTVYWKLIFYVVIFVMSCAPKNNRIIDRIGQRLDIQQYTDTTSVEYIALETTPECLLGRFIRQLLVTDSCIFIVNERPNTIYMFGRDGKFIRQISKIGRAPGEYLDVENITVNEPRREITLYDPETCQAMKFDYNGNHLASFANSYAPYGEITQLNDTLFALQDASNYSGIPQNPRILILNDSGKIVNTFIPQPQFAGKQIVVFTSCGFFAKNATGNYYIPHGTDTIYSLSADGRKNEMILALGIRDYMVPMDISQEEYEKLKTVKCNPVSDLCITDEGIFSADVNFYDNGGVQLIGTLKDNILLAGNPSADADAWPGLINPRTTCRDYFVGLMSATEASQFKDKFPDMAEDANPVVIFFKYKLK